VSFSISFQDQIQIVWLIDKQMKNCQLQFLDGQRSLLLLLGSWRHRRHLLTLDNGPTFIVNVPRLQLS
jgi:hypothetical protein